MKFRFAGAAALCLAVAQVAAAPAFAEEAVAQFRTAAPQRFSSEDLQRYGLAPDAADRAVALQKQGYEVRVLTHEEAKGYQAGITDNQWILLGILAGVIVIAVAVSD
jgi:hypothetical protein